MRFKFNKKYLNIALIALWVIILSLLAFFIIFNMDKVKSAIASLLNVLRPVTNGLIIAYLFSPLINFFERKVFIPLALRNKDELKLTRKQKKTFRALSIILSMVTVYALLAIIFRSVIPQIGVSISRIVTQFPVYMETIQNYAQNLLSENAAVYEDFEEIFETASDGFYGWLDGTVVPYIQGLLKNLSLGVLNIIKSLWYIIIGMIISIYVLFNKEVFCGQAKKVVYALLPKNRANLFIKDVRFVSDTFINFLVGKIIDSIIVGVICFICCNIFKFPYPLLVAVIVGVTNIIPVFGPFLGAIPAAFLILMVDPVKCLYFIIFILVLQQVDGHIIGPRILGEATGISGFWVIFAITVFGGLWGIAGMFIGIPLFAVIYALIKRNIDRHLNKKGLPTETYEYMPLKRIEENGDFTRLVETEDDYFIKERERKRAEKEKRRLEKKAAQEKLVSFVENHIPGQTEDGGGAENKKE